MEVLCSLDCFLFLGVSASSGGPEKARMLASAGMASFAVQALWNRSLALWLKQSVRLDHFGVTIFQLSRMQMLRGSGRILAEQKIKFQTH